MPSSKSLIKVIEVWVPDGSGEFLELSCGSYGQRDDFRIASESVTFAPGEPLPGLVWKQRVPMVLPDLDSAEFKRRDAALEAGLNGALAIPIVDGDRVRAVVLLLCDDGDGGRGAFEVWSRDARQELALSSDYYANLERMSTISHYIRFPRGAGVPGRIWDDEAPSIVDGLTAASGFTRSNGAGAEGLDVAVGMPVMRDLHDLDSVILFLSSNKTPLAAGFEIWSNETTGDDNLELRKVQSTFSSVETATKSTGQRLASQVAISRKPSVVEENESWSIGLPLFVGNQLRAVLTLLN